MSWIKQRSASESLEINASIAKACKERGGIISDILYYFAYVGEYKKLIDFKIDYSTIDMNDAIYARQIQALYSKLDFLELGIDRDQVTFDKFLACEEKCRDTNRRFRMQSGEILSPDAESILFMAQRKISDILGPLPDRGLLDFTFGPGANTNVNSRCANPRVKLSADITCSTNLTRDVAGLLSEVPHWAVLHSFFEDDEKSLLNVTVTHGKLSFVPKTSLTHRPIVVEPLLNSFFQKGVGKFIRQRLKRAGVDLQDQSKNQRLAEAGSRYGHLATIDLSSASDCISRNLVYSLLPYDWADELDLLRTPSVTYGDTVIHLEKFSSMGNGYTFELESLIFYALAYSVCRYLVLPMEGLSVYGDDLIVPVDAFDLLGRILEICGFSMNMEKSFSKGPFRESCGADYFHGMDIRPFYLKTRISDRNLYTMHNWFIRHGEIELARIVESFTRPQQRIYGPNGYGDGHLIGSFSLRLNRKKRRLGWCGGYFETYSLKPASYSKKLKGDVLLPTYSVYTRSGKLDPTDPNVVRGSRGYAKLSIYTFATSVLGHHCLAMA